MDILLPGLRASVTHLEYASGVGSEYQELFITTVEGKVLKRISLPHNRKMILPVDKVPVAKKDNLPEVVADFAGFFPGGRKIPVKYLDQIIQFFKAFMKMNPGAASQYAVQHSYEAMAHIVWSPDTGYRVAIPTQIVSGAHVSYEWDHLAPNEVVLVDIHSHNSMGAFFSGTDNGDDNNKLQFSGVIGQLDKPVPATKWRFNDTKNKYEDIQISDIFEAEPFEVPKEWMDRVSIRTYQIPSVPSYGQAGQRGGYYHNPRQRNDRGQFKKKSGVSSIFARKVGDPLPEKALSLEDLELDLGAWGDWPGAPAESSAPVEPKWIGEDDIIRSDFTVVRMPYFKGVEELESRFINTMDMAYSPTGAVGIDVLDSQYDAWLEIFGIDLNTKPGDVWIDMAYAVPAYAMEGTHGDFMACLNPEDNYISMLERVHVPVLVTTAEKNRLESLEGAMLKPVTTTAGVVMEPVKDSPEPALLPAP
jgi:hypothetical protein